MSYTCRICGHTNNDKEYEALEMMYGTKDKFTYFECDECGCLQIADIPEDVGKYYADEYYSFKEPYTGIREGTKNNKTRILDIGCGAGAFLCQLSAGFTNLTGCDPFIDEDKHYENGVNIYKKSIHEMDGEYDVIFMQDSYEHVTDPHEVFDSLRRLLSPEGIAIIRIPIYPNIAFEMFGTSWYQLDAPRHIYLHSVKSMHYMAEKHGLQVSKVEFDSTNAQIVRSFLYTKGIPYVKQDQEVLKTYFTQKDLDEISAMAANVNKEQYGDHASFTLMKSE